MADKKTQAEIDRKAGTILRTKVPDRWLVRSQEDQLDYGVDFEIEVMEPGDRASGNVFKIQQKGADGVTKISGGDLISQSGIKKKRMWYYLHELQIPVILTVVDIRDGAVYWTSLQGNSHVHEQFRESQGKPKTKTMTVHLPVGNTLPDTANELLAAVEQVRSHLALRRVQQMSLAEMRRAVEGARELDLDAIEKQLQLKQVVISSARVASLLADNRHQEARTVAESAFSNKSQSQEARFTAGLTLHHVLEVLYENASREQEKEGIFAARLGVTHEILDVTWPRNGPPHLVHYAVLLARSVRMRLHADVDFNLFLSRQLQEARGDELAVILVSRGQRLSAQKVIFELRKVQVRLLVLIRNGWLGAFVFGWCQAIGDVLPFLLRLINDQMEESAKLVASWFDEVGELARAVAYVLDDPGVTEPIMVRYMTLGIILGDKFERAKVARTLASELTDIAGRKQTLHTIDHLVSIGDKNAADSTSSAEPLTPARYEDLVRKMARALGINLDDPDDFIANVVNIGIRDINPERVLRNCQLLRVEVDSCGEPARMLDLPTAGFKSVICKKYGYRISGLSLDSTYDFFASQHCEGCADREPHPAEWKWSHEWQREHQSIDDESSD